METINIIRSIAALSAVLALLAGSVWLAQRRGGAGFLRQRNARRLAVVERLTLDPKRQLLLLRCDAGERLLLLTPDAAIPISLPPVSQIDAPAPAAAKSVDPAALKARWSAFAERQSVRLEGQTLN